MIKTVVVAAEPEQQPADLTAASSPKIEDSDAPVELGDWYMVKMDGEPRRLMCVVGIGSNHVAFRTVASSPRGHMGECETRVATKDFFDVTRPVSKVDAEALIARRIGYHQGEVARLSKDVQELVARLAVTPSAGALDAASPATSAITIGVTVNVDEYKGSLVKAKEKDLPALHKAIADEVKRMSSWAKMSVLPLEAKMLDMEKVKTYINDRLFAVDLYAGIGEEAVTVSEGEPAAYTDKVHVMQRRLYMDEECLLHFDDGGMRFSDMEDFDKWIARPENRDRIMPFPRTLVSFRVRRYDYQLSEDAVLRGVRTYGLAFAFAEIGRQEADKRTYLYVRNGERIYRIDTRIQFHKKLFPDDYTPSEKVYFHRWPPGMGEWEMADERRAKELMDVKEGEAFKHEVRLLEPSDLYYDDMLQVLKKHHEKHRRVVVVLQGLLDRSEVFHPHPPASLWTDGGFESLVTLVRDDQKVIATGKPFDYEAYIHGLRSKIKKGTVVAGQWKYWDSVEPCEYGRHGRDQRRRWWLKGPPNFVVVDSMTTKGDEPAAVIRWLDDTKNGEWNDKHQNKRSPHRLIVPVDQLYNVSDYEPGVLKRCLDHPTTRADYAKYLEIFSASEAYHKGDLKVEPFSLELPRETKLAEELVRAGYARNVKPIGKKDFTTYRWVCYTTGDKAPPQPKGFDAGKRWRVVGMDYEANTIIAYEANVPASRWQIRVHVGFFEAE